MLDAWISLTNKVLQKVTMISDLSHEQNKALSKKIIRDVQILEGSHLEHISFHACRHVLQVLICQLAGVEVQALKIWVDQMKLNNIVQKVAKVVVRQVQVLKVEVAPTILQVVV